MELFLLAILGLVAGYFGGWAALHIRKILVVAIVLGCCSTASAYTGYWHNPQPPRHCTPHYHAPVAPRYTNPYQRYHYAPQNRYYAPAPTPRHNIYIQPKRTPNRSFYFGW